MTPSKAEPAFWEGDVPWISPKDMKRFRLSGSIDTITEAAVTRTGIDLIVPGAVLMVTRGMILDRTVPVALNDVPVTLNQDMKALLPQGRLQSAFLAWSLLGHQDELLARVEVAGHGTCALRTEQWGALPFPLPPLPEQTQIARFLDYETAKIDRLIEKQQQLIALLKEKRQAVISHAVTKGLNPDAPMKDSGVEWLGQVPAHWTVGKCGFYLRILSGFAFPSAGFSEDETDTRLLRGINVGVGRVRWDETVRWKRHLADSLEPWELSEGDVVIGMDRPMISEGVRVAKLGPGDTPSLLLQRVAALHPRSELNSDYLMHMLSLPTLFEAHFAPETTGVSVPHISPKQIADFVIPIPPRPEQDEIVALIDQQTGRMDKLVTRAEVAADLLQERRAALISAAVTGKIDVRTWTPPEAA